MTAEYLCAQCAKEQGLVLIAAPMYLANRRPCYSCGCTPDEPKIDRRFFGATTDVIERIKVLDPTCFVVLFKGENRDQALKPYGVY